MQFKTLLFKGQLYLVVSHCQQHRDSGSHLPQGRGSGPGGLLPDPWAAKPAHLNSHTFLHVISRLV